MPFDPTSLFATAEQGVIYDVQILASMFQDSAGTVAAAVDSPVGRINDLSGNGNHAVQATAGLRPVLRQSAGRGYYLEADGTDDQLAVAFTIAQPITRISLVEQLTWVNVDHIFSGGPNFGASLRQFGSTPALVMHSGTYTAGTAKRFHLNTPGLVTEIHNGASSQLGINQDPRTALDAGTTAPGGISLFGSFANLEASARLYGVLMINRVLTATEIEDVQYWLTARYARVLAIDGDSNTAAEGVSGYGLQYLPNASPTVFLQNVAYAGTGLDVNIPNDLATAARITQIDARIPANKRGRQYVYVASWNNNMPGVPHASEPLGPGDGTAASNAARVALFLQARTAAGWDKVGICTLIERTDVGQNNTAVRGAYNAIITAPGWIAANGIDFLVDFGTAAIGADGASANATLFEADLVHMKAAGHASAETVVRAAVNGLALPSTGGVTYGSRYRYRCRLN